MWIWNILEEAYQFLVDYCTEWYMQNDPEHLLELSNGKKKLPLTDKKDILTEMYLWCRY